LLPKVAAAAVSGRQAAHHLSISSGGAFSLFFQYTMSSFHVFLLIHCFLIPRYLCCYYQTSCYIYSPSIDQCIDISQKIISNIHIYLFDLVFYLKSQISISFHALTAVLNTLQAHHIRLDTRMHSYVSVTLRILMWINHLFTPVYLQITNIFLFDRLSRFSLILQGWLVCLSGDRAAVRW
jgi:hypothetical protein